MTKSELRAGIKAVVLEVGQANNEETLNGLGVKAHAYLTHAKLMKNVGLSLTEANELEVGIKRSVAQRHVYLVRAEVEEAIDALSGAPDLDKLSDQGRAIRDRLLNAWSTFISNEEHDDWLDKVDAAIRRRKREL